jgi:hypothetical protein
VVDEKPPPDRPEGTPDGLFDASALDEFVPEIAGLLNNMLGLGAAMTRTLARAADPAQLGRDSGPLDEMVRNGVSTLANLVRLTIDSLQASTQPRVMSRTVTSNPRAAKPGVQAGDTLRMPLFIENPSAEPTGPLRFGALEAVPPVPGTPAIAHTQVRCSPETLDIGARDFEKLTVFVDTELTTPLGRHLVRVGVPGTAFVTTIEFDVLVARDGPGLD